MLKMFTASMFGGVLFALTLTLLSPSPPASAVEEDVLASPVGYLQKTVCVSDTLPKSGWRIPRAMRIWNDAQTHVRFTKNCGPGMGIVTVGRINDASHKYDHFSAYVEWGVPGTTWTPGVDGVTWFYDMTTMTFNDRQRGIADEEMGWRDLRCWSTMVAVHEFAHALGLQHNDRPDTVVNAAGQAGCGEVVGASDLAALDAIYAQRP